MKNYEEFYTLSHIEIKDRYNEIISILNFIIFILGSGFYSKNFDGICSIIHFIRKSKEIHSDYTMIGCNYIEYKLPTSDFRNWPKSNINIRVEWCEKLIEEIKKEL